MNKIYRLLIILLLPLSALSQPQTITLNQCREMALENSYSLNSASQRIAASEDMLKLYKSNNLPNLSFSGGYIYSTASLNEVISGGYLPTFSPDLTTGELTPNIVGFAADGTPIFSSYAYMPDIIFDLEVGSVVNAGLQLTQPIYLGGKISCATKLAKLGVEAAILDKDRSQADVILAADQAFYTYLKVEELLRAANSYRTVV
ncbi:MAG: TolC family protein, partial [Rikenellaceae bacterium]